MHSVGVVGIGTMGMGLVGTAALRGLEVVAISLTPGGVERGRSKVAADLEKRVARGKLTAQERDDALGRITFSSELSALTDTDLVVECLPEDLATKREFLPAIEKHLSRGAVLATNTSSLPFADLASTLQRPDQFIAMHFFNPVSAMELVELARTDLVAPGVVELARRVVEALGKTPVEVTPSPGYVVNRLLVPVILHAIQTVEAGIADAESVDRAMKLGCGHPMGPLALADLIGLDVVMAMAQTLQAELNDRRYRIPSLLRKLVTEQQLGRKSQIGFYDYRTATPSLNPSVVPVTPPATHGTLEERAA